MDFHVGDQVVHSAYGPGEIVQLDEKVISGHSAYYYVVKVNDMTLFVPKDPNGQSTLRLPTPAGDWEKLYAILSGPSQELPPDRYDRKTFLQEQMKDGRLESICRVIRDLHSLNKIKKLNESDAAMLQRAEKFLLKEWKMVLSVSSQQAEDDFHKLFGEQHS